MQAHVGSAPLALDPTCVHCKAVGASCCSGNATVERLPSRQSKTMATRSPNAVEGCINIRCMPPGLRVTVSPRSEEHTYELQSLMRLSYAVFCLQKKQYNK